MNNLDDITTLEEAKQEISRLREFQKKSYYFLGVFCNYDVKQPLLVAEQWVNFLQNEQLALDYPNLLKTIQGNFEKIKRLNQVVIDVTAIEEGGQKRLDSWKEHYSSDALDNIDLILEECASQIRVSSERQNQIYAAKQVDNQDESNHKPTQVNISFSNKLPVVRCNPSILKTVLSDLVWFIAEVPTPKTEIAILTDYDEQYTKIILRCATYDPHQYIFVLREFERFEIESTFFGFHPLSLFLYKSWHMLKMYDALLSYRVQDNTETKKTSIVEITVCLQR